MIEDFLKKYQDSLKIKEKEVKTKLTEIEIEIRRQQKYLEMISSEQEAPFSAFTPHATDQKKALELDEQFQKMDMLQLQRTELNQSMMNINDEISNVEHALKEVDEQNKKIKALISRSNKSDNIKEILPDTNKKKIIENNQSLAAIHDYINDIKLAASFLPADPVRAKQLLTNIIDNINSDAI